MRPSTTDKPMAVARAKPGGFPTSPFQVFCGAALIGALCLVLLYDALFGITSRTGLFVAIGVGLYLVASGFAAIRLYRAFPHRALGLCNLVTLARLVIVGVLCVVVMAGIAPNWATFSIAAVALSLDGLDGWLARRQALSSDFGADFDVEVDAALALVLALYAATNGAAGAFVILLGLPHYLFRAARMLVPWLDRPLPPRFSRKAVCVFQIGALIALQVPFLTDGGLDMLIAAVALALIWSFGRDILWLRRKREGRA